MKAFGKTLAWSLLFLGSAAICLAQEFPPTLDHNKGPFPTGTEAVRNDSPVDAMDPSPSGVIHEYTAYQGTPVVDGDVMTDEVWNKIPWTPMEWHISFPNTANTGDIYDGGYSPENWDGWDDITAWFKVLWDQDYIYVATRKVDDNYNYLPGTDTDTGNIWQNDAYQIHIDSRPAGQFDAEGPGAEIGLCLVEGMEVYNFWSINAGDKALELADGNNTTGAESCLGKAFIAKQEDTATGYAETMEMAFILWPEIVADEAEHFSIMVLDRDYDLRDCGFQWAQGIYVKTQDKYGSIFWSSKAAPENGVEDKAAGIPESFVLQQNFPNPFNPTTMISYRLLQTDQVKLEVFDISGRLVSLLVDEKQSAGSHSVTFDAKGLNTGTYLCRLKAGSSTAIRKMLFVQ